MVVENKYEGDGIYELAKMDFETRRYIDIRRKNE